MMLKFKFTIVLKFQIQLTDDDGLLAKGYKARRHAKFKSHSKNRLTFKIIIKFHSSTFTMTCTTYDTSQNHNHKLSSLHIELTFQQNRQDSNQTTSNQTLPQTMMVVKMESQSFVALRTWLIADFCRMINPKNAGRNKFCRLTDTK